MGKKNRTSRSRVRELKREVCEGTKEAILELDSDGSSSGREEEGVATGVVIPVMGKRKRTSQSQVREVKQDVCEGKREASAEMVSDSSSTREEAVGSSDDGFSSGQEIGSPLEGMESDSAEEKESDSENDSRSAVQVLKRNDPRNFLKVASGPRRSLSESRGSMTSPSQARFLQKEAVSVQRSGKEIATVSVSRSSFDPIDQGRVGVTYARPEDSVLHGDSGSKSGHSPAPTPVKDCTGGARSPIVCSAAQPSPKVGPVVRSSEQPNEGTAKPKTWSSLFADNRRSAKCMKLPCFEKNPTGAIIQPEFLINPKQDWSLCLVGYIPGKFPGPQALRKLITNKWKAQVWFQMHASGWIIFRFKERDSMEKVLQKSPYKVFGIPLILKVMPAVFLFQVEELSKVPVWVQLWDLPLQLWTDKALGVIASQLGKPIYADKLTASTERVSYARLLVEIDLAEEAPNSINILLPDGSSFEQSVFYENLPKFCKTCNGFGHEDKSCLKFLVPAAGETDVVKGGNKKKLMNVNVSGSIVDIRSPAREVRDGSAVEGIAKVDLRCMTNLKKKFKNVNVGCSEVGISLPSGEVRGGSAVGRNANVDGELASVDVRPGTVNKKKPGNVDVGGSKVDVSFPSRVHRVNVAAVEGASSELKHVSKKRTRKADVEGSKVEGERGLGKHKPRAVDVGEAEDENVGTSIIKKGKNVGLGACPETSGEAGDGEGVWMEVSKKQKASGLHASSPNVARRRASVKRAP